MSTSDSASNDSLRLKRWLKAAGLRSYRLDTSSRMVNFVGRTREFAYAVSCNPTWVNITTTVCEVPSEPGIRARLMDWALRANRTNALVKFSIIGNAIALEVDYRTETVDETVFGGLIHLITSTAESQYPAIFRIVNGDDVLESLGRSLAPQSAS